MADEILRTFIAIEIEEQLRTAIVRVQSKLMRQTPEGSVKWVSPHGIHLTLKFLGDTPARRVPEIEAALKAACAGIAPIEFAVEGRGCFPNSRRPRVIWVAVRDRSQALQQLQAAIERHVAPLGWPTETRGFSAHLTLGRTARHATAAEEAAIGAAVENSVVERIGYQRADEVSLIKSDLRPAGALYTVLARVPLAGGKEE